MPKFSVDIQAATEYTFQVEADSAEEAEATAMSLYNNADEVPSHEEVLNAVITNCEEI